MFYSSRRLRCSMKKGALINCTNSQEGCNFIKKETLPYVFSCEFCEISKNALFIEHHLDDCFWFYLWRVFYIFHYQKSRLVENRLKQTFHISNVRISQKVKGVLTWNLQHIIFMRTRRYWQIFKYALVHL